MAAPALPSATPVTVHHHRTVDLDVKGACCFQLQSRDEPEGTENLEDVNVEFIDEVPTSNDPHPADSTALYSGIYSAELDLQTFLSRPTRIISTTIAQGASFAVTRYDPWSLFLGNTAIKNKLENYHYLRGDLKINVLVNSSPFIYGLYALSYCPIPGIGMYDVSGDPRETSSVITSYTQRSTIYIKPHTNEGGTMTLPFIYPKNYIEVQGTERANLGRLDLYPIVSLAAASASSQGCSVNVYAWMENVSLAAPTMALQGKDEYATGPISYPASVVAGVGARLKDVPVIGKFARATEIGAGAIGKIASLFGFSKVPEIDNSDPTRIMFSRGMASAITADVHEKLALDPKNELAVDTKCVGFDGEDELNVARMCERSCVLTTASWQQADAVDFTLFSVNVCPTVAPSTVSSSYNVLYDTPVANVSRMFMNWRGDIVYTLQLVASQYHQGRLIVSFDPAGGTPTAGSENTLVTKVWDIQETDKITFRIPFVSATNWKQVNQAIAQDYSVRGATSITFNNVYHTGRFSVRVGNALVGPLSSANATLVVHTHMEEAEFANPVATSNRFSVLPIQSKDEPCFDMAPKNVADPESYSVNMGERIQTLRTLMQRENFFRRENITWQAGMCSAVIQYPQYPGFHGYANNPSTYQGAITDCAKGLVATTTNFGYWWLQEGPIQWMGAAFIGYRGAMKWRALWLPNIASTEDTRISISRNPWPYTLAGASNARIRVKADPINTTNSIYASTFVQGQDWSTTTAAPTTTASGITIAHSTVNPSVVAEIPLFSEYNFEYTGYANIGNAGNAPRDIYWNVNLSALKTASGIDSVEVYCAAGTDFSMVGFVNVPPRYYFTTWPTAV